MTTPLEADLEALPPATLDVLERHGFQQDRLVRLVARALSSDADDNRVNGVVRPPEPTDVISPESLAPQARAEATALGRSAIEQGQVALVVLAGGMATRMGGVVKALVPAIGNASFLDLRLRARARAIGEHSPLWLMTSHATDRALRAALGDTLDGYHVATFVQHLSLRVTLAGRVYKDAAGEPSLYAPGHGDLPDALQASGLLDRFVEAGGRVVMVANIDNIGATIDPLLVGMHLRAGIPVSCEVVDKVGSDRGGIPVRLDDRPVILEEFRLPTTFDPTTVRVFNTNTFLFDARSLQSYREPFSFFAVRKEVGGETVLQFERLINEVTSHLPTRYLHVSRTGAAARFLPVKDHDELARRQPELEAVARDRGMLP